MDHDKSMQVAAWPAEEIGSHITSGGMLVENLSSCAGQTEASAGNRDVDEGLDADLRRARLAGLRPAAPIRSDIAPGEDTIMSGCPLCMSTIFHTCCDDAGAHVGGIGALEHAFPARCPGLRRAGGGQDSRRRPGDHSLKTHQGAQLLPRAGGPLGCHHGNAWMHLWLHHSRRPLSLNWRRPGADDTRPASQLSADLGKQGAGAAPSAEALSAVMLLLGACLADHRMPNLEDMAKGMAAGGECGFS